MPKQLARLYIFNILRNIYSKVGALKSCRDYKWLFAKPKFYFAFYCQQKQTPAFFINVDNERKKGGENNIKRY